MRRFQFEYNNERTFIRELDKLKMWVKRQMVHGLLFHIFCETVDKERIKTVCDYLEKYFPDADYVGCTTNGNIVSGDKGQSDICVSCTMLEYPDTQFKVFQLPLEENSLEVGQRLKRYIEENPWVKAVELLTTINGISMTKFCESFTECRKDVCIFGGGAFSPDINANDGFVFSKGHKISTQGVILLMMGGEDFHMVTMHITGWKPLGREFTVTKAKDSRLYELDGQPAYDVYYKYFHINNDENFFENSLEFPIFYKHNGIDILRAPTSSNEDGSLNMTSAVDENVSAKLAYGDPEVIIDSVKEESLLVAKFQPDVIDVFSCAARLVYWGANDVGRETMPFETIAPTLGFFTSGEFLRTEEYVNQHNVTLVIAAMREGDIDEGREVYHMLSEEEKSGKINMIKRLTTFINAVTSEMEEANRKLAIAAISDALTGLLNRGEIQRRISRAVRENAQTDMKISLIMMDLDDFKKVNDSYGHKEGDNVLIGLANVLRNTLNDYDIAGDIGRWGGEEFMVLLPDISKEKAHEIAEKLLENLVAIDFPLAGHQTMSLGVTEYKNGEDVDILTMRVDGALYDAKGKGKNQVIDR